MTSRRGLYHPFRALLCARRLAVAVVLASLLVGCGERDADGTWELPNGDLAGTRAASGASIDAGNVSGLVVRWRYALTAKANYTGTFASTPVADDETVYVQDLQSNVHALERATGKVALGAPLPRARTKGRTGSRWTAGGSTARPTRMRSRSPPTPAASCGAGISPAPPSSSSTSRPSSGKGSSSPVPSASRRAGGARSTRWTPRPVPCAGSSTRSGSRGGIRSRPAGVGSGIRCPSTTRVGSTRGTRTRSPGADPPSARTAPPSPARCSTRTRCSCSTRAAAGCSGTTR